MSEQSWIATLANEKDQPHNAEVRWISGDVDMMHLVPPSVARETWEVQEPRAIQQLRESCAQKATLKLWPWPISYFEAERIIGYVDYLRAERDRLREVLVEAASSLDRLSDGECDSRYGPGCDMQCKNVAYQAWAKAVAALNPPAAQEEK